MRETGRGIDWRKDSWFDEGVRKGKAFVGECESCKKDLVLIGREFYNPREGIADGAIR